MSCYHPKTIIFTCNDFGEVTSNFSSREFYKNDYGKKVLDSPSVVYAMPIPCGKCLGCKLDYSRSWADRMCLEYDHTKKAVFITLTYNDAHLKDANGDLLGDVEGACLCKRDIQLFMKRLRKRFPVLYPAPGYPKAGIRFYGVGEYGPKTFRPHYHFIIFGLEMSDFADDANDKHIYLVGYNDLGQPYYSADILQELWSDADGLSIGFVGLSDVTYETFAYVARYTLKKAYKDELSPEEKGLLAEWSLMSRKPGISRFYLSEHPENFLTADGHLKQMVLPFSSKNPVKSYPKYLVDKLLDECDSELYFDIRESRQRVASDKWFQEIQKTDKSEYDYLLSKEVDLQRRTKSLVCRKNL